MRNPRFVVKGTARKRDQLLGNDIAGLQKSREEVVCIIPSHGLNIARVQELDKIIDGVAGGSWSGATSRNIERSAEGFPEVAASVIVSQIRERHYN